MAKTKKGAKEEDDAGLVADPEVCTTDDEVDIYVMGKRYTVPASLTIMKALEHCGYVLVRGVGCREGFCGACATVFRRRGDYKLYSGLACQTLVEDGMYLSQIPAFPAPKAKYDVRELEPSAQSILKYYPELARCVSCNSCTKVCPQEINVMDYVNEALRGDIARAAHTSFDCIMCGLCAARCHAEMPQYLIGILARRLYAAHIAARAPDLEERVSEILDGRYDEELEGLKGMSEEELKKLYKARDIEPT